ncbi:MAG TPA: hypothetical protein PLI09_26360 [Candidatus Hydrogenedentes bacterium]|nr:hypothetical protein [Candidatus Hydrogenedentota bacterium]
MARKNTGAPGWTRTSGHRLRRQDTESCKDLGDNDLQKEENPVTPTVTPQIEKGAILEALRGMGRDELLMLLAEALVGKNEGRHS